MTGRTMYPFNAIVGQDEMKLALILNIINPGIAGVLIRGEKGTAKSTAVRALADILPLIEVVKGCPYQMSRAGDPGVCRDCYNTGCAEEIFDGNGVDVVRRKVRVVELPVSATEDRVVGTMDIEHALSKGEKRFEPGILAAAHRGILYVDEINLLDDHVVDVLLDAAAMGVNTVEREGVSFSHPARFTLVGTMNPEEGELRPQLLDRFGLCVSIEGSRNHAERVEVMERRIAFEDDPEAFCLKWKEESARTAERIESAIKLYPEVNIEREKLFSIATRCMEAGVDGHRGDIITLKTAKTLAAWHGRVHVTDEDIEVAAGLALPHRMRRQPFEEIGKGRRERGYAG
ncbi:MAG TPA: magnesium chelatase ATPase subunit I [Nitrospirae bacterium]|nr:magnesium chelatase ATPase subunit I [Nitrospirota bacterium]